MTRTHDGRVRVRFGDVVRLSTERCVDPLANGIERYVGLEHLEPSDLRIRTWGNVADGVTFTNRFRPGQVLFGKRRAYQRKVAVADFDGICSSDIYVFEPADDRLLPDLLPFICQTDGFFEHALKTSAGSLSPRTNWSSLADYEFQLPLIEEQRRVAALLMHERVLRDSLTQAMADARLAVKAFTTAAFGDDSTLVPLRDLATVQVGFPFPSDDYVEDGVRLLRCSNVGVNRIDWTPAITRSWPTGRVQEVADYRLQEGDIVIAMDRPFISEGFKVARLADTDIPSLLLQRVGRVRLTDHTTPGFIWAFLHSPRFQHELQRLQKGTDLPHISRFDIESTTLPRSAVDRQAVIAEQFEVLHRAEDQLAQRLRQAETVLGSVRSQLCGSDSA
jgi:type I restriction enzyme S subunit